MVGNLQLFFRPSRTGVDGEVASDISELLKLLKLGDHGLDLIVADNGGDSGLLNEVSSATDDRPVGLLFERGEVPLL